MGPGWGLKSCLYLLILSLLSMVSVGMAGAISPVTKIQIITPQWEGQTNEDGTGLFFEIVQKVYKPMGIKVVYGFATWKRSLAEVTSGNFDAMLCVWQIDAQRANQLVPKYPIYVEVTAAIFKRVSIPHWQGIHTLDLKRAVWLRGYDYHTYEPLRNVRFSRWHEVDSYEDAWHQLNLDRFDVYIDSLIDLEQYIKQHSIDMKLYRIETLGSDKAYISFSDSDNSRELIQIFDGQIQKFFRSGELEKIYQKWDQPFYPEYWEGE